MRLIIQMRFWLAFLSMTLILANDSQCSDEKVFPRAIGFPDTRQVSTLEYNAIEVSSTLQSLVCAGVIETGDTNTLSWPLLQKASGDTVTLDFYETAFIHIIDMSDYEKASMFVFSYETPMLDY